MNFIKNRAFNSKQAVSLFFACIMAFSPLTGHGADGTLEVDTSLMNITTRSSSAAGKSSEVDTALKKITTPSPSAAVNTSKQDLHKKQDLHNLASTETTFSDLPFNVRVQVLSMADAKTRGRFAQTSKVGLGTVNVVRGSIGVTLYGARLEHHIVPVDSIRIREDSKSSSITIPVGNDVIFFVNNDSISIHDLNEGKVIKRIEEADHHHVVKSWIHEASRTLYMKRSYGGKLYAFDLDNLESGSRTIDFMANHFHCVVSENGDRIYVNPFRTNEVICYNSHLDPLGIMTFGEQDGQWLSDLHLTSDDGLLVATSFGTSYNKVFTADTQNWGGTPQSYDVEQNAVQNVHVNDGRFLVTQARDDSFSVTDQNTPDSPAFTISEGYAVDTILDSSQSRLYVTDRCNDRVAVFNTKSFDSAPLTIDLSEGVPTSFVLSDKKDLLFGTHAAPDLRPPSAMPYTDGFDPGILSIIDTRNPHSSPRTIRTVGCLPSDCFLSEDQKHLAVLFLDSALLEVFEVKTEAPFTPDWLGNAENDYTK